MAETEQRTETRSSEVIWTRLVNEADPDREQRPEVAYQFSNGRTFISPKGAV